MCFMFHMVSYHVKDGSSGSYDLEGEGSSCCPSFPGFVNGTGEFSGGGFSV